MKEINVNGAIVRYAGDYEPTLEETERTWRDSELTRTDSMLQADRPNYQQILDYRIALRAYPQQSDFPNGTRPVIEVNHG